MEKEKDIRQLYETQLKDQLAGMEKMRKNIKKRSYLFGLCLVVFYFLIQYLSDGNRAVFFTVLILGIIGLLFQIIPIVKNYFKYRKEFKEKVVAEVIKLINPDFQYNPNRHIEVNEFNASKLFSRKAERCSGDDFIQGKIDQTDFKFSEIKAQYKTTSREDGKEKTEWHIIFRGLFFHADFNKNLEGSTFVLPDTAEKLLGKFGQNLQKSSHHGKLVRLENPEFEKQFAVFSGSQQEARYILTPTMMEAIVNIHKKMKRKMYFSFTGSRVYFGLYSNKALFEPRINSSGLRFEDVEEMYLLFSLIETIIQEMNLNTRIWTKE